MGADMDLLSLMSTNRWFAALPLRERKRMLGEAELISLRPREMVFRQGDPPGDLYAVVSGEMKVSTVNVDGKEAILAVLQPGTWFGEISLIDDAPRSHDASAVGEVELLRLPRPVFNLLMRNKTFALAIAQMVTARIRLLYSLVEDATMRTTRARIAHRLLMLAKGDTTMSAKLYPKLPLSQESLAMMLGITRQTLSKELKGLVQLRAISLGYAYIEVLSEEKLKALSEGA